MKKTIFSKVGMVKNATSVSLPTSGSNLVAKPVKFLEFGREINVSVKLPDSGMVKIVNALPLDSGMVSNVFAGLLDYGLEVNVSALHQEFGMVKSVSA